MDAHEFLESKGIKSMGDAIPAKVVEEWLNEFAGRKANRFDALVIRRLEFCGMHESDPVYKFSCPKCETEKRIAPECYWDVSCCGVKYEMVAKPV